MIPFSDASFPHADGAAAHAPAWQPRSRPAEILAESPTTREILTHIRQQLDTFPPRSKILGEYTTLGPDNRASGGEGVVQFCVRITDTCVEKVAIKFFASRRAYDREVALYGNQRIRRFMPRLIEHSTNELGTYTDAFSVPLKPFIVMERGTSLFNRQHLMRHVFSTAQAVCQLAECISELHRAGFVHRDLKPSNVLWQDESNRWLLIDFGLAAEIGVRATPSMTPAYAAPEVMRAHVNRGLVDVHPAIDAWAFGVIIFELLVDAMPMCSVEAQRCLLDESNKLPWEGSRLSSYERRKMGHLYGPLMSLLQRNPQNRSTPEQFSDQLRRLVVPQSSSVPGESMELLPGIREQQSGGLLNNNSHLSNHSGPCTPDLRVGRRSRHSEPIFDQWAQMRPRFPMVLSVRDANALPSLVSQCTNAFPGDGRRLRTSQLASQQHQPNRSRRVTEAPYPSFRLFGGHSNSIWSVAWSRDSTKLATTSPDQSTIIWDVESSRIIHILRGHEGFVRCAAWRCDGACLATASNDHTAILWDTNNGTSIHVLRGHKGVVTSVTWSPDGGMVATASFDHTAILWEVASGIATVTLRGISTPLYSIAWSPDTTTIATTCHNHTTILWDVATASMKCTLEGHDDLVWCASWSPDSKKLATASFDSTAKLWDTVTGEVIHTFEGHSDKVTGVTWSPDGSTVATSSRSDQKAFLWNVDTGEVRQTLTHPLNGVESIVWSCTDDQLATCSDKCAVLWSVSKGLITSVLKGHAHPVNCVCWGLNSARLATASFDKTAILWDTATAADLVTLYGHTDCVLSVAFSPNGALLATASKDKTVMLWDTAQSVCILEGHTAAVGSLDWCPDGSRLVSASDDMQAILWDMASGNPAQVLCGHSGHILSVAWSPDTKSIATASSDCTAIMWDVARGFPSAVFAAHSGRVLCVAWSPDSSILATTSEDRTVKLWDVFSGEVFHNLEGHDNTVHCASWSPDGSALATASRDESTKVWDVATATVTHTLLGYGSCVLYVSWSPDGASLATALRDSNVIVWEFDLRAEDEEESVDVVCRPRSCTSRRTRHGDCMLS